VAEAPKPPLPIEAIAVAKGAPGIAATRPDMKMRLASHWEKVVFDGRLPFNTDSRETYEG
jgi:hypothetical protein